MAGGMMGPRSSALPYHVLGGVEPCAGGWLVVPGNLQGINLAPQPAYVPPPWPTCLTTGPLFPSWPCMRRWA